MFLKILEIGSLGMVSVGTFIAQYAGRVPGWLDSGGLIALVGFMIVQNYRQQQALGRVITKKDEQLAKQNQRIEALVSADIETRKEFTKALNLRPCMKDKDNV